MVRTSSDRSVPGLRPSAWKVAVGALAVTGLVMATAPLLGSVAGAKGGASPLYIGSVLGTTGSFAGFDAPEHVGLETVVSEINQKGGILGHKLVYVNINDDSQTTKFGPGIEQLLSEHKYLAVFPTPVGYISMLTYTNAEHIITFGGQTPDDTDFTPGKFPYDFNDSPLSTDQLKYAAKALQTWAGTKPVKVGIIENSLTSSESQMAALAKILKAEGATVLPIQTVATTATDVSLQLSQLQSGGANVVYSFPDDSLCTATFTGVQTLAWKVKVLGNPNCLNKSVVQTIPSTILPDLRFYSVADTMLTANGKLRPRMAAFTKQVLKTDPTAAPGIAAVSADAVHDLAWAAGRAKSVAETKILKALNSMYSVTIPANTFLQEPNPRWSPSDHEMDRATFNGYYGIATVAAPPVTGLWKLTKTLSITAKTSK
jgi:branched-chain amino acid transport system substrate-binding protein